MSGDSAVKNGSTIGGDGCLGSVRAIPGFIRAWCGVLMGLGCVHICAKLAWLKLGRN